MNAILVFAICAVSAVQLNIAAPVEQEIEQAEMADESNVEPLGIMEIDSALAKREANLKLIEETELEQIRAERQAEALPRPHRQTCACRPCGMKRMKK